MRQASDPDNVAFAILDWRDCAIPGRSQLRLEILTLDYRFAASGTMDTPRYLQEVSALDQQKAQTWRGIEND